MHPKGYAEHKPAQSPRDDWFAAVRPECKPQLWALILFDAIHGRRAGEGLGLPPDAYDPKAGTVLIGKTKNGEPVFVKLAQSVIEALEAYSWQDGPGLFGYYTKKNRRSTTELRQRMHGGPAQRTHARLARVLGSRPSHRHAQPRPRGQPGGGGLRPVAATLRSSSAVEARGLTQAYPRIGCRNRPGYHSRR